MYLFGHLLGAVGLDVVKRVKTIKKWFLSSSCSKTRIENRYIITTIRQYG